MARDIIHNAVKNALVKDGWTILADPYKIKYEDAQVFADLAAELPLSAEREGRKIVAEIKSFRGSSLMREMELALGQYKMYEVFLSHTAPEYDLYLAISNRTYERFFKRPAIHDLVKAQKLAIFVVDLDREEIVLWINPLTIVP